MSGTACRALVLRKCGLFLWLALGTYVFAALSAFADDFTLQNQSLQLVFRIAPFPGGGISIIKIRDIQAGIDWLTNPGELFELSAGGKVWASNSGLVEDSLSVNGTQLQMTAHTSRGEFTCELLITLPPGTGPATVSASFKNQGPDWFGPFFLGDQGSGAIPVFPVDAELAVVQRNPQQEELLVSGFDGILYTSEERGDGPWSVPKPLQPTNSSFRNLFLPGAAIAAVRRNYHQRDAFAIGKDGLLHTVFRLDDGWWSDPIQISALRGVFPPDGSVAAISVNEQTDPATASERRVNEVAVFAVSVDGQVRWTTEVNDGPFPEPTPINGDPRSVGPHAHLVAVKRNQTQRDLFTIDQQGVILTAFQLGSATNWSNWIPLSRPDDPRIAISNSRFAAVRGSGDNVHLFVAGAATATSPLARIYETHEIDDGAWTNLAPITPPVDTLAPGTDITAVRRSGGEIDVLAVLKNGTIGFLTRNLDGSWSNFSVLPAASTVAGASGKLAAILRRPQQLDIFGVNSPSGKIWTNADGAGTAFLRTVFPKIIFRTPNDLTGAFGMVPQEVGSLTALDPRRAPFDVLGMPYLNDPVAQGFGLPQAMNFLDVVNISRGQRSLFLADLSGNVERGRAPIQFSVAPDAVDGFWVSEIKGGHTAVLSFAIGVGDPDWRRAIDYFLSQHSESSRAPDTPAWLREAGAIYALAGGGIGGIYLKLPGIGTPAKEYAKAGGDAACTDDLLKKNGFTCILNRMLREGQDLGTKVLYLDDYWEPVSPPSSPILTCPGVTGAPGCVPCAFYWCKGDYFIREDLGGETDLAAAIANVHTQGGRVILYLEPFLVYRTSAVGNAFGELWGSRLDGTSPVWTPFDSTGIAMSQANGEWQDYVVQTAKRLIQTTKADGIFLDSFGWRLNVASETKQEVVRNSSIENAMAVLDLVDRVRTAIRTEVPDAVVLSETTSGPMYRHVDGGVSADFIDSTSAFTGRKTIGDQLLTSPVRYALPQVNIFSNGQDSSLDPDPVGALNELNQIFATGHGLALCANWDLSSLHEGSSFMFNNASYIKSLVQARQNLASALVYGRQVASQDIVGNDGRLGVAYSYSGSPPVVTVLNPNVGAFTGTIPPHSLMQPGTRWQDVMTQEDFIVTPSGVNISIPPSAACCAACSPPMMTNCGLRILKGISP